MRQGVRFGLAVMFSLVGAAACTDGSESAAEAACREKGYMPGTVEFAECLHPKDAKQLERAQDAWERDSEDIKQ